MSYEQKPNSGTMGRVPDEKRTSEKFPEFDGKLSTTCPHCGATLTLEQQLRDYAAGGEGVLTEINIELLRAAATRITELNAALGEHSSR